MPPLARLVRGHKNPFQKEDDLTAGIYCFQYPTLGFKTVSEQYGTLRWKTSNVGILSKPAWASGWTSAVLCFSAATGYCLAGEHRRPIVWAALGAVNVRPTNLNTSDTGLPWSDAPGRHRADGLAHSFHSFRQMVNLLRSV